MSIEYTRMDCTTPLNGVIMHGCNAQGVMGSGVAKVIKEKFPIAFERYKSLCDAMSEDRVGLMGLSQLINVGGKKSERNGLFVANAITQLTYGKTGARYADPEAIAKALLATFSFAWAAHLPVYMPRVGCGLGGLLWNQDVEPHVLHAYSVYPVDVTVCDWP